MATRRESEKKRDEGQKARAWARLPFSPLSLLFYALCFFYLWLVVEPHLIYYSFGTILPDAPLFATGWSFLRDSLGTPGGPVTYTAGLFSVGYRSAWLGAAVITLAGFGLAELTRRHLVKAGLTRASVAAIFPAIALFLIYSDYKHPLVVCLTVLLGLFLSLLFERWAVRRTSLRIAGLCLMTAIGFWLGGAGTLLVLATMTVIYGILVRRDWTIAALTPPVSAAIVWALSEQVFLIPAHQAFLIFTPFAPSVTAGMSTVPKVLTCSLYGFTPIAVLLVLLGKTVFGTRQSRPQPKRKHAAAPIRALLARGTLTILPFAVMALGLFFSYDQFRKPYVLSNYYSRLRQWDKIIELNRHLPAARSNVFVSHDYLRALYHTGRLPYDMLHRPLVPQALLLTHEEKQSDLTLSKLSDIFLELGHVNMAQKQASELVATKSQFGPALETLGWIGVIRESPATARVYWNALERDPGAQARAQSLLRYLDSAFTPEQTAWIGRIRSCMRDETAGVTGPEGVDQMLAGLLERNPRNKMAFEYLMACYLLTGQVDKVAQNIGRLKDLGYQGIPTLYEEALIIDSARRGKQMDLTKLNISSETLRRYEAFVQVANTLQPQNEQLVLSRLIRDFGTSYFFYFTFGRVGVM